MSNQELAWNLETIAQIMKNEGSWHENHRVRVREAAARLYRLQSVQSQADSDCHFDQSNEQPH